MAVTTAPNHARYDWQTLNHFADISGEGVGVTLANADCLFMKVGDSTVTALDTASPQISVLVGGQIDGENLGIPRQGGDSHFVQRFALQTHAAYDEAAAMRFALAHQNPLVAAPVTGQQPHYPETTYSLLKISDPRVLLWSLKPAEDGIESAGIALRVWNLADAPAEFTAASGVAADCGRPACDAHRDPHGGSEYRQRRLNRDGRGSCPGDILAHAAPLIADCLSARARKQTL